MARRGVRFSRRRRADIACAATCAECCKLCRSGDLRGAGAVRAGRPARGPAAVGRYRYPRCSGRASFGHPWTLARGVVAFSEAAAAIWRQTVVLGITEFGRSAHFNDQGGTDHGSASVAFLMGGAIAGGRIAGRWPGLAPDQLHEGTDLAVTTDARSIVNAVLKDHLGLSSQAMAMVAPNASGLQAIKGLFLV
ncbi:MAG: DUF1501 domain-containing protein [Mesorhizobium sp.]|nr:MAG: DUF1501 domain-containing protein [Mesorhizobium sp.]